MSLHWPYHSWDFPSASPPSDFWDGLIMRFHGVYLLRCVVELENLGALVAAGAGLLVFKW